MWNVVTWSGDGRATAKNALTESSPWRIFRPSGAGYVHLPPQRLPQLAIRLRTRRLSISGVTDIPKDRPKCEAQEFEKAERRKAVELVDAAKHENRAPLTLATAAERWWHEVGQYTEETDLEDALKWLIGQIGGKRGLQWCDGP